MQLEGSILGCQLISSFTQMSLDRQRRGNWARNQNTYAKNSTKRAAHVINSLDNKIQSRKYRTMFDVWTIKDLQDGFSDAFYAFSAVTVAHYKIPFGEVGLGGDGAFTGEAEGAVEEFGVNCCVLF